MPMIELFQAAVQLAADSLVFANPKDLGDLVGGEAEDSQFASALEDLVNGEIPPEDEIPAVLQLVQGIATPQVDGGPVFLGELGPQNQGPIVQALADNLGTQSICGGLQGFGIGDPEEGIVILVEADALALSSLAMKE